MQNLQVVLASRPHGPVTEQNFRFVEAAVPSPGAGEVLVRNTAVGGNFIDTYHRSGLYPIPLPSGLGLEAAGGSGGGIEHRARLQGVVGVGDRRDPREPDAGAPGCRRRGTISREPRAQIPNEAEATA